nr:acyltransferase family protein [Legionella jordanis]
MIQITIQILLFTGCFLLALLLILPCARFFGIQILSSERDSHLDGIRGIAAMMVVCCHINQHLLSFFNLTQYADVGNRFGLLGVEIFFGLTAYLFTKRAWQGKFDPATFYISRIRRIVPLYLFACLMTLVFTFYFAGVHIPKWSLFIKYCLDVISFGFISDRNLMIEGFNAKALIGVAWSLSYEWKFYLFLPVLYYLYQYSSRLAMMVCAVLFLLAARDFYEAGAVYWPFFMIGSSAAVITSFCNVNSASIKRLFSILFWLFLSLTLFFPKFSYQHFLLLFPAFIFLLLGEPSILTIRPLVALGRVSYSIYLLQYLVLMPVVTICWSKDIKTAGPILKFAAAYSVVCILIPFACFTYKYIELKWLHGKPFWRRSNALESVPA